MFFFSLYWGECFTTMVSIPLALCAALTHFRILSSVKWKSNRYRLGVSVVQMPTAVCNGACYFIVSGMTFNTMYLLCMLAYLSRLEKIKLNFFLRPITQRETQPGFNLTKLVTCMADSQLAFPALLFNYL